MIKLSKRQLKDIKDAVENSMDEYSVEYFSELDCCGIREALIYGVVADLQDRAGDQLENYNCTEELEPQIFEAAADLLAKYILKNTGKAYLLIHTVMTEGYPPSLSQAVTNLMLPKLTKTGKVTLTYPPIFRNSSSNNRLQMVVVTHNKE